MYYNLKICSQKFKFQRDNPNIAFFNVKQIIEPIKSAGRINNLLCSPNDKMNDSLTWIIRHNSF